LSFVLVLAASLFVVPSALAAPSPTQTASHNPAVNTVSGFSGPDGTPAEPGDTPEQAVARQFPPNTVETFRFDARTGENGSFSVAVGGFANPAVDLDIYVFRVRSNQTIVTNPIASAATLDDPEIAEYASPLSDQPLRGSEYIVAVHNYCSSNTDPGGADGCEDADDPDGAGGTAEDDWDAEVTFRAFVPGNKAPSVSLSGPTTGRTGEALTYTATPSDPEGQIASVAFDLDGDGLHETNAGTGTTAQAKFVNPGRYSVGVRVIDAAGAAAFSSVDVRISGASTPGTSTKRKLVQSFRLNRPVFGGRSRNRLVIRYRLREAGRVTLTLYRGKKRIRRLSRGNRVTGRTYTVRLRPRKLKRGAKYTIRMSVVSTDRKATQQARLSARRL
jgi:hypothetical protein